jgi:hypothetical protein
MGIRSSTAAGVASNGGTLPGLGWYPEIATEVGDLTCEAVWAQGAHSPRNS